MTRIRTLCSLAAVLALLAAGVARAQGPITFRLEVPAGLERIEVSGIRLLADGLVLAELSVLLLSEGGGSSIALPLSSPALPDRVELDYRADAPGMPGTETRYVVAGAALDFTAVYVLPVPSPGGTIEPAPGDPATSPSFRLSVPEPSPDPSDVRAPKCSIVELAPGLFEATVRDEESGLARVRVRARNGTAAVPAFEPGTTEPVVIPIEVPTAGRRIHLLVLAYDRAGNLGVCRKLTPSSR